MTMGRFHQNSAGDGLPVQPAFEAELPLDGVIFHVPHDSTDIPADVRNQFTLDDQELKSEILNMTDHFSARLFCSDIRHNKRSCGLARRQAFRVKMAAFVR